MSQHISFNVGRVAALCSSISHSSQRSVRADVVVIEVLLQLGSVLILLGSQPAGIEDWGSFKLQVCNIRIDTNNEATATMQSCMIEALRCSIP